jgi:hypothetical protein
MPRRGEGAAIVGERMDKASRPAEAADGSGTDQVPLLTRRRIEAGIAAPLIRAFAQELGAEAALRIAGAVVADLARQAGTQLREVVGGDQLADLARGVLGWSRDGALELTVQEHSPCCFAMTVTRCRFAEMYRELGLADLGYVLSCARDFALAEGFNPGIRLERTRTLMEGADGCDFRFLQDGGTAPR